jgi:hypothetical protein
MLRFETQRTPKLCSLASLAMVLNALRVPAPIAAESAPFAHFTQGQRLERADRRPRERARRCA